MADIPFTFRIGGGDVPCVYRYSLRARRIRITLHAEAPVITLVLPSGVPLQQGLDFLEKNRGWLGRHLPEVTNAGTSAAGTNDLTLFPQELPLPGGALKIEYRWNDTAWVGVKLIREENRIEIQGRILDPLLVREAMTDFLKRFAETELAPQLAEWSQRTGIAYDKLTVRLQKGRWGSCSSRRSISLNGLLIFFPSDLADYVMVHELCHLREMNHSPAFWREVARFIPDHRQCRSRIRRLTPLIPAFYRNL